jgi:cyclopropane-fatty-acyl-phospholipid synthase
MSQGQMSDGATQAAIEAHYDVGREFYRLWLDPAMVYSCALWPDLPGQPTAPGRSGGLDDDLAAAQQAKLAWHADAAGITPGARVLDVGCGWGALLHYLVEQRGAAHATGLTLSSDQADEATTLLALHSEITDVRLEDWRDHKPAVPYDAIVSIGAFEHFTHQGLDVAARREVYRQFFSNCSSWLAPGGRLSLQTIAYEDFDETTGAVSSFFTDEIFPESALPHLSDVVAGSEGSFRLLALRSDADQYERTLHLWQRRLEANKSAAIEMAGADTYRRYLKYLRVSRAMFDRRVCTLYRIAFQSRL